MSGELFEVHGTVRWSPLDACPLKIRGKVIRIKSKEGDVFEMPAEVACMSLRVRNIIVHGGTEEEIPFPLSKQIVAKIVEYCKHHKDHPCGEIRTPLESDNLAECGVSRWDASFVTVDNTKLFDLILAASLFDIPSLFFLTSAKAALAFKDKSADKVRKELNLANDLPAAEEEEIRKASARKYPDGTENPNEYATWSAMLQGVAAAAEKQGVLEAERTEEGPLAISIKSWRHACWRAAVLHDWRALATAPAEVRVDKDLFFAAIMTSRGAAMKYAPEEVRSDRKLVLEATKYYGTAFSEASKDLRSDREFVLEAVQRHGAALFGAAPELRSDRGFLREAARIGAGSALQGATAELRNDADLVLELAAHDPEVFKFAAEDLRSNREFALTVAKRSGGALQHMLPKFKADRQIVQEAVSQDPNAVLFAHTSRRADLGMALPWDSQVVLSQPVERQEQTELAIPATGGPRMLGVPLNQEGPIFPTTKLSKMVQFSALSTMTANMGQANYCASNAVLDKFPFYERPELDSVTLMWGAVGNIGMRWKAFASADFLNATPEALLSITDACKVLHVTAALVGAPEWYAATFFDEYTRQFLLSPSAGKAGGKEGGGWKPGDNAGVPSSGGWSLAKTEEDADKDNWRAEGLEKGFLLGKDLEDARAPKTSSDPLGGWPGLFGSPSEELVLPQLDPVEGARVRLVGLRSKSGITGTLLQQFADGKWKVKLDDNSGNALLRASYLEVLAPPALAPAPAQAQRRPLAVADIEDPAAVEARNAEAAARRRAKIEERRSKLKEKAVIGPEEAMAVPADEPAPKPAKASRRVEAAEVRSTPSTTPPSSDVADEDEVIDLPEPTETDTTLKVLLKAARPDWKESDLVNVMEKLSKVQILTVPDLLMQLRATGADSLNMRLKVVGEKSFTAETLRALREQCRTVYGW